MLIETFRNSCLLDQAEDKIIMILSLLLTLTAYAATATTIYQLRQLRVISRSLTSTATATLVHAFVTSRLDYCSTLYIGLPAVRLGCIERVIRTAARLI